MKRWKAVMLTVAANLGMAAAEIYLPGGTGKRLAQVAIASTAAAVAKKTSESNPNGTPAEQPWVK